MIKLHDILLSESIENKITTTKVEVAVQKLLPMLNDKEQADLMLLFTRFLQGVDVINSMPYSIFNRNAFHMDVLFNLDNPVNGLKLKLVEWQQKKDQNLNVAIEQLVKALDDIYTIK
jgi:hypothetical protein